MTTSLVDLMQRIEPLHPDLQPYVTAAAGSFPMLRHPLLYVVPYAEPMAAYANAAYAAKCEAVEASLADDNFGRFVWLHERPFRAEALCDVAEALSDEAYWSLVRQVYQDSENVEEVPKLWSHLLESSRPARAAMMTPAEQGALAAMPDTLTVWRGAADDAELSSGFSWTLDIEVAHWFACRFNQAGIVARAEVSKHHVWAYLTSRGEEEIMAPVAAVAVRAIEPAQRTLARAAHRKKLDIFSDAQL